jgi:Flp pilus assembly protein TadB
VLAGTACSPNTVAQTKRKRTRKHRGTPAGTIARSGRTGRGQNRQDAKSISRQRREERLSKPPSWRGSVTRAAIAAAVFGVLVVVLFKRPIAGGVALAGVMFLLYIPLGYATDLGIYRFRQRRKADGK